MVAVLGIETSCDETAAAVVVDGYDVRSSIVASQHETHAPFGGVVPELAARAHAERIDAVIGDALTVAGIGLDDLDAVAATVGPGLAGALLVGLSAGQGLALAAGLPFIPVNHLEAHLAANRIADPDFATPAVVLLVSGGHTMLVHYRTDATGTEVYELLGETVDDAVGEAYDKVARLLGLGYPGGPAIDRLAAEGDAGAVPLPRPMRRQGLDFSFSGLKTAVVQAIRKAEARGVPLAPADVAAGFQAAAVDTLVAKLAAAVELTGVARVAIGGGVAANSALRSAVARYAETHGLEASIPAVALCQDNAAMIAARAAVDVAAAQARCALDGPAALVGIGARPSWPIGTPLAPGPVAGRRP